ncbi:MAG: invasion associated locus B family protein [Alphaproteobacteria bacterium]|jgi:invasion protein IalB|nr:invasion associated locus B family protein [Alphaproteobacteria bacterium]MBP9877774.1 invasion associated locus B family protein [Alphaproteobacteria bacterium]
MLTLSKKIGFAVFVSAAFFVSNSALAATNKTIDDWQLVCGDKDQDGRDHCMMTQTIVNPENNLGILSVALGTYRNKTQPSIAFNLPPQINQDKEIVLVFDQETTGHVFHVSSCDGVKCTAVRDMNDGMLNSLKNAKDATVHFDVKGGENVKVHISLKGFESAYRQLIQK